MAQDKTDKGFYQKYYREIDVLHGLQSTPKDDVKQSDIVLYLVATCSARPI